MEAIAKEESGLHGNRVEGLVTEEKVGTMEKTGLVLDQECISPG
jgi:hypothetical protein